MEVERLTQDAEDARADVEARLAGMTAALDERSASLAAAAAEVRSSHCSHTRLPCGDCTRACQFGCVVIEDWQLQTI